MGQKADRKSRRERKEPIEQAPPTLEVGRPAQHVRGAQVVDALNRFVDTPKHGWAGHRVLRLEPDEQLLQKGTVLFKKKRAKLLLGVDEGGREGRRGHPLAPPLWPQRLSLQAPVARGPFARRGKAALR